MEDLEIADDVIKSFYFTQELAGNNIEQSEFQENQQNKVKDTRERPIKVKNKKPKLTSKITLSKLLDAPSTSYVIRKEPGKAHHLIKISICDLSDNNLISRVDCSESGCACVNVQYLVKDNYDEIMNEAEYLVGKIVTKLSSPTYRP